MSMFVKVTLTVTAIAALGLASGATPAQAQETAKKPRHCVQTLVALNTPAVCYDNFTAAIAAATDGEVIDAPADVRVAMNDQGLLARLNYTGGQKTIEPRIGTGSVLIGILFRNADFDGDTQLYQGNHFCSPDLTDIDFSFPYVGDSFNDDGESLRVFANCRARLFEHSNFQGAVIDWAGDRSDFGILADKVSSLQFS
jgi:hypothetical protein